jgi:hypothetical protein
MLQYLNSLPAWRRLVGTNDPDLHMKDLEILLRGFAMLLDAASYAPSMMKFLNQFSKKCQKHDSDENQYLRDVFERFLSNCSTLPDDAFFSTRSQRFNIALFESVFSAICRDAIVNRTLPERSLRNETIRSLADDADFLSASQQGTTKTLNVHQRLERAREIVCEKG